MGDAPDADDSPDADDADTSAAVELDLSDPDREEAIRRVRDGDLDVDDIKDPKLREHVEKANERVKDPGEEPDDLAPDDVDDEPDDTGSKRVQLSEDGDDDGDDLDDDFAADDITVEENVDEDDVSVTQEGEVNVMDGVDDEDVDEAMGEATLNVRDDIDPEHFDYDEQEFDQFGGYDEAVTIEYNDAFFRLEMPSERVQQQLINEMQQMGSSETEMMNAVIKHTVTGPSNIEDVVEGWTPFERLGLGVQCIQFLGLDALGNM